MQARFILSAVAILIAMMFTVNGCGGGDSSPNTNTYNLNEIVTKDASFLLIGRDNDDEVWKLNYRRTFSEDDFVNGVPVKNMNIYLYTEHVETGVAVTVTGTEKYLGDGNMVEEVDNSDSTVCLLENNPHALPTDARVDDFGEITAIYSCNDGTSYKRGWSLSDAGNGNAAVTLSYTFEDSSGHTKGTEADKYLITANNEFVSLEVEIDMVDENKTLHLKGSADSGDRAVKENYEIVYINNGAVQCESKGLSKEQTARILIDNDIDVIDSQCGYLSNLMVAALCGLGDTNINLHTINAQDLVGAQALGFKSVSTLKRDDDKGYAIGNCPK